MLIYESRALQSTQHCDITIISNWSSTPMCFPGGYNYVQIFLNTDPLVLGGNSSQLSNHRTTILTDNDMTTCISRVHNPNNHTVWFKVLPHRSYLFGKTFSVFIAGGDISCSPVDGISVAVQPTCNENGNCTNAVTCTGKIAPPTAGQLVCEYRCQTLGRWDFVATYTTNRALIFDSDLELCEIWFSNWYMYSTSPY